MGGTKIWLTQRIILLDTQFLELKQNHLFQQNQPCADLDDHHALAKWRFKFNAGQLSTVP